MPLTLTLTEGAIPKGTEQKAAARLCDAMVKWHGLTGNKFMTPNITASVHIIPKGLTLSGSKEADCVWIEWKTPSIAWSTNEIQQGYFEEAVAIIHEISGGKLPKKNIWFNVVHTVDGAWGIDGQAMTDKRLGEEISKG